MNIRTLLILCLLAAATVATSVAAHRADAARDASQTYRIDPVHSTVIFRVKHLGVSYCYGRFTDLSGTFSWSREDPESAVFEVSVKAESIDTADAKRDQHLKSPDFFNSRQFPTLAFKSQSVRTSGDGKLEVRGDLSLHGVTRPLTATLEHVGAGPDPWGGHRCGFETTFTIKRSDFGMNYMQGPTGLGDEVRVIVSLEGVREK